MKFSQLYEGMRVKALSNLMGTVHMMKDNVSGYIDWDPNGRGSFSKNNFKAWSDTIKLRCCENGIERAVKRLS